MLNFKKYTKKEVYSFLLNNFLIVLGSVLLAFGTAIFLTKLTIVPGGFSGIGMIVQANISNSDQYIDIIVGVCNALLWFVALIWLGKKFALKTLVSSIVFPLCLSLFLRVQVFIDMANSIAGDGSVGNILVCAIFGGVFIGGGVAITFLGGGSTGGTDVIIALLAKKTPIKESIWSFIIDFIVIFISLFTIKNNTINSLCGIICAFIAALLIDYLFNGMTASLQADIISSEWEKISKYVQDEMGRGATLIPAKGGYKGTDKIILRVVFDRRQLEDLKRYISEVDPKAFVTYTKTNAVYGEGFTKHGVRKKK